MQLDNAELKHSCNICELKFLNEKILNYHKTRNHKEVRNENGKFSCKKCHYETDVRNNLRSHVTLMHSGNHQCNLCYKKFKFKDGAVNHMTRGHGGDEEHFFRKIDDSELQSTCRTCDLKFLNDNILKYHITWNHGFIASRGDIKINGKYTKNKDGTFTCLICNWFIGLLVNLHDQTGYTTNNCLVSCRISS